MALAIGAVLVSSPANPCCCPGGDCCLYPGQAFVDMLYPSTDLPATLVVTIDGNPYTLAWSATTPYYSGTGGGFDITIEEGWRLYLDKGTPDEQFFDFDCLISTTFVPGEGATATINSTEDEFPTSLSVDIAELSIVGMLIDRLTPDTDPCTWYGCQFYEHVDDEDHFLVVTVRYNSTTYKWEAIVEIWNGADCGALSGVISTATQEKSDPQDTPVGSYLGTYTVTVS